MDKKNMRKLSTKAPFSASNYKLYDVGGIEIASFDTMNEAVLICEVLNEVAEEYAKSLRKDDKR
jgi:hypothetical protein